MLQVVINSTVVYCSSYGKAFPYIKKNAKDNININKNYITFRTNLKLCCIHLNFIFITLQNECSRMF